MRQLIGRVSRGNLAPMTEDDADKMPTRYEWGPSTNISCNSGGETPGGRRFSADTRSKEALNRSINTFVTRSVRAAIYATAYYMDCT